MGERLNFTEAFKGGLRRDSRAERNVPSLVQAQNVKALRFGLRPYEDVTDPLSAAMQSAIGAYVNPHPMIFRGKNMTLLADTTDVYDINEVAASSGWIAQNGIAPTGNDDPLQIKLFTAPTGGDSAITGDAVWHFADFWNSWFLTNGTSIVFQVGGLLESDYVGKTFVEKTYTAQTCCTFRGRLFTAGLSTSEFWKTAWDTYWLAAVTQDPSGLLPANMNLATANMVWWSTIGGGDFLMFLDDGFGVAGHPSFSSGYSTSLPIVYDYMKRNEAGLMPMPFQGTVQKLLPMTEGVVVYCEQGVGALVPYSQPVPAMGYVQVSDIPVAGRGMAAGSESEHVWLDPEGTLWHVDNKFAVTELGYKEWLSGVAGDSDGLISYDPHQKEYYFTGGGECFVLSKQGLTGPVNEEVIGVARASNNVLVGIPDATTAIASDGVVVQTETFHGSERGVDSLDEIKLVTSDTSAAAVTVQVKYKLDSGDGWTQTDYMTPDGSGIVRPLVSGVEFRLVIRGDDYANLTTGFDDLYVTLKAAGKRDLRALLA